MPQFTYLCSVCSLQFKRRLSQPSDSFACPSCGDPAKRDWAGQTIAHAFQETLGSRVGNSGVSKHDYPTADNIVGRDAERRWAEQHARTKAKASIRSEGVALARTDTLAEGQVVTEYTNLSSVEFDARKKLEGVFKKRVDTEGLVNVDKAEFDSRKRPKGRTTKRSTLPLS